MRDDFWSVLSLPLCFLCRDRDDGSDNLTRATAFGNRTLSGQRRESSAHVELGGNNVEEMDEEMAAMAKVWAHPEDLHKYPVRILTQLVLNLFLVRC